MTWSDIPDAIALILVSHAVSLLYTGTSEYLWCICPIFCFYCDQTGIPTRQLPELLRSLYAKLCTLSPFKFCVLWDALFLILVTVSSVSLLPRIPHMAWHVWVIGGPAMIVGNLIVYFALHEQRVFFILKRSLISARRLIAMCRWTWKTISLCRRRRKSKKVPVLLCGRISRPDQCRKSTRRKSLKIVSPAYRVDDETKINRKPKRHGETRPSLNTDILPPTETNEMYCLQVFILFAMNPAIAQFCWKEAWEPALALCVFQHLFCFLGLFFLGWTAMATKLVAFGARVGFRLCRFPVRRALRDARAATWMLLPLAFTLVLLLDTWLNPNDANTSGLDEVSGPATPRQNDSICSVGQTQLDASNPEVAKAMAFKERNVKWQQEGARRRRRRSARPSKTSYIARMVCASVYRRLYANEFEAAESSDMGHGPSAASDSDETSSGHMWGGGKRASSKSARNKYDMMCVTHIIMKIRVNNAKAKST